MKKLLMAAAAVTVLLSGCNEAREVPVKPDHILTQTVTGNVVEIPDVVKTSLDKDNYFQVWTAGDQISVIDGTANECFTLYGESGTAYGTFKGKKDVDAVKTLFAVYPYSETNRVEKDQDGYKLFVTYPSEITYDPSTGCAMGNNVMVAANNGTRFEFHNAGAIVKVSLTGSSTITGLSISDRDGEDIAGTGEIRLVGKTNEVLIEKVEGAKSVNVDFGEAGLALSKEPVVLTIGIAPVSESGLVCKYTTTEGDEVEMSYDVVPAPNSVTFLPTKEFVSPTVYLVGETLNAAIKTLAAGSSKTFKATDSKITKIVFATGVDLSKITGGVDVSMVQDGRILATYNSGVATISTNGEKFASDLKYMFFNLNALTAIDGFSAVNTRLTTSLDSTFMGCKKLASIDLGSLDLTEILSSRHTFDGTAALASLDVTPFANASKDTSMAYAFNGCGATEITGIDQFNTSSCRDMSYMFASSAVKNLDLKSFNTASVVTMESMFQSAKVQSVDLSGFTAEKVKSLKNMFSKADSLATIDLSSFTALSTRSSESIALEGTFQFTAKGKIQEINLGSGFVSLYGSNQQTTFLTSSTSYKGHFDLKCTRVFAQELIAACTAARNNNPLKLINAGQMVLKNLDGKEYTFTDAGGNPQTPAQVTKDSIVIDPE